MPELYLIHTNKLNINFYYRYRRGIGKFVPENINTDLCTHIVYGFAVLDYSELTIKTHDSWADLDNNFYERVVALKERGVKVSLAIGGWNDSQGDKYSRLVRSKKARTKFISHVIQFLEKFGFEGLDLGKLFLSYSFCLLLRNYHKLN